MYGVLLLIGVYFLRDILELDFKIPILEGFAGNVTDGVNASDKPVGKDLNVSDEDGFVEGVVEGAGNLGVGEGIGSPSDDPGVLFNESYLPVAGPSSRPSSCYPQNTLGPDDLLPLGEAGKIKEFNDANPAGEGILKGVNFLDAGFHTGVNTVGQSLRNANLNLRAEPANPRVQVSPWMNTTIDTDLARKALDSENVCGGADVNNLNPQELQQQAVGDEF